MVTHGAIRKNCKCITGSTRRRECVNNTICISMKKSQNEADVYSGFGENKEKINLKGIIKGINTPKN